MKKKLLSVLLCLCMVCSLLPATALAADSDAPRVEAYYIAGQTVNVNGTTDGYYAYGTNNACTSTNAEELPADGWTWAIQVNHTAKQHTIYLNGYDGDKIGPSTISGGTTEKVQITVDLAGTNVITSNGYCGLRLSSTEAVIQGSGSLSVTTENNPDAITASKLTINSGTISAACEADRSTAVSGISADTVIINGGTVTASATNTGSGIACDINAVHYTENGGTVTAANGNMPGNQNNLGTNGVCFHYGDKNVLTVKMPSSENDYTYGIAADGVVAQIKYNASELPASGWNWAVQKHAADENGVEYTLILNQFNTNYVNSSVNDGDILAEVDLSYGLLFSGKLNLELRGTNTMTDTSSWVWAHLTGNDDLYISGDGQLTVSGGRHGYTLGVFPTLHITGGTVTFDGVSSNVMHQGGLDITGGTFTASSSSGVFFVAAPTLGQDVAARASTSADGSDPQPYDSNYITRYKWFKSQPAVNAKQPTITTQPSNATYTKGATPTPLTVEATSSDGGTLTYQWKKGDGIVSSNIEGATTETYTPSTASVGTMEYTCVVTNMINDNGDWGNKTAQKFISVQITVTEDGAATYSISLSTTGTYTFPPATEGYSALTPLTVTVTNTGTAATGNLHVYLTGNNTQFELSENTIISIEPNGTATFTVAPKTGNAASNVPYTAQVSVMNSDHNIDATFTVKFTVNSSDNGGSSDTPPSTGDSGSGGSNYTPPTYKVESDTAEETDGSVSLSTSSAQKGDTVTITVTPDTYYQVDGVIVKDRNGNIIEVTENKDGTFSFKMPASKVTVEAVYSFDNPFVDVKEDAYYAPAVEWALVNGVTGGTTAETFAPTAACTRGQMMTFLWRAAGCPEPVGTGAAFEDVSESAYYAKAIQWAVEQGITSGTTAATFSPNAACSRAHMATFLYRMANGEVMDLMSIFEDVSLNAYYADAVQWALEKGITNGTGDGSTYSPNATCTRGQMVTFLYRFFAE